MDNIKKNIILNTIIETGIFDSSCSGNTLLSNAINKRRSKIRLQKNILTMITKKTKHKLNRKQTKKHSLPPKYINFLTSVEQFSDDDFQRNFMMKRSTFTEIANYLQYYWKSRTGRPSISIKTALYITLWKLIKNCTFNEIAELFNISKGGIFAYFIKVVNLLYTHRKKFIKWPKDFESKLQIMKNFQNFIKNSIPHTIGCVDAIHISIVGPKEEKDRYLNKNGEYSIILQGICDSQQKFIDVYFDEPGSSNKSAVWENSPINDILKKTSKSIEDGYILGDSEYPLKPYLIVPYCVKGSLTAKQNFFNYQHSSLRFCVKQAFEILKAEFPILDNIDIRNINYIKYIVMACIVLHNIIIEKEETNNLNYSIAEENNGTIDNDTDITDNSELNKAKDIREKLAMYYMS